MQDNKLACNGNSFNITNQDYIPITVTEETIIVVDTQESPASTKKSLFDQAVVDKTVLDKSACKTSLSQDMNTILNEVKELKQFKLTVQAKLEVMEEAITATKENKGLVAEKRKI